MKADSTAGSGSYNQQTLRCNIGKGNAVYTC